jgi:hypothetical protein
MKKTLFFYELWIDEFNPNKKIEISNPDFGSITIMLPKSIPLSFQIVKNGIKLIFFTKYKENP